MGDSSTDPCPLFMYANTVLPSMERRDALADRLTKYSGGGVDRRELSFMTVDSFSSRRRSCVLPWPHVPDIVKEVWNAKTTRQVIFTSHNANIVVNGDADLILCWRP